MGTTPDICNTIKRTASLLERLLPHLDHCRALNWAAQFYQFKDWHDAHHHSASNVVLTNDSDLYEHRYKIGEEILTWNDDEVGVEVSGEFVDDLLIMLGFWDDIPPISLPRIAYLQDGCAAWEALQYDRLHDFAQPIDPRYCWSASVYEPSLWLFPAGSSTWSAERVCQILAQATKQSCGFQVPQSQLMQWSSYLREGVATSIAVDEDRQKVTQRRVIPLLLVRSHERIEALIAIECLISAYRERSGVSITFRILDSIGAKRNILHVKSALYNSAHEDFESLLRGFQLLTASDHCCRTEYRVESVGSKTNAIYAEALEYGLSWEGEI
ncbi:hypothetical protein [Ralstonia pseudosolanacearum]|uniref:hypothetical protein n=1 Tax=Ralstonia pseudosolanacearum TaxID=1310165 RepID=UPI003CF3D588